MINYITIKKQISTGFNILTPIGGHIFMQYDELVDFVSCLSLKWFTPKKSYSKYIRRSLFLQTTQSPILEIHLMNNTAPTNVFGMCFFIGEFLL